MEEELSALRSALESEKQCAIERLSLECEERLKLELEAQNRQFQEQMENELEYRAGVMKESLQEVNEVRVRRM